MAEPKTGPNFLRSQDNDVYHSRWITALGSGVFGRYRFDGDRLHFVGVVYDDRSYLHGCNASYLMLADEIEAMHRLARISSGIPVATA